MKRRLISATITSLCLALCLAISALFWVDEIATQAILSKRASDISDVDLSLDEHSPFVSSERLEALAVKLTQQESPNLELIESLTQSVIAKNPRRVSNYNRLVYLDIAKNGTLTNPGIEALDKSLFLSPYGDIEAMKWRLQVANVYWDELTEPLRRGSLAQITALANSWGQHKNWLIQFGKKSRPVISDHIRRSTTGRK